MSWTLLDLAVLARKLVAKDDLILRDSIIGRLVNDGEIKDEEYWASGLFFDKSSLKVVSLVKSIWNPLKVERPELFSSGASIHFDIPKCQKMDHKLMSYCIESEKDSKTDAQIVIHNEGDRLCVRRFLEAKELLHFYTRTVVENGRQINFLTEVLMEQSLDGCKFICDSNLPLEPEAVGFYLAIEVLLPWCLREQLNKMIDARCTNFQIAKAFMVPEFVIRHVRNVRFEKVDYLGVSYRMNCQIDKYCSKGSEQIRC